MFVTDVVREPYPMDPKFAEEFVNHKLYQILCPEEKKTIYMIAIIVDLQLRHRVPIGISPQKCILGFHFTREDILHATWRKFPEKTNYIATITDPTKLAKYEDDLCEKLWTEVVRTAQLLQGTVTVNEVPRQLIIERRDIYCEPITAWDGHSIREKGHALSICENRNLRLSPDLIFYCAGFDKAMLEVFGFTNMPNWYEIAD